MKFSIDDTKRVGQLRWARVFNPREDSFSEGKIRPVVLIEEFGDRWRVMGLTTKSVYSSGGRRVAIPNPFAVGLSRPGYLWGSGLTPIRESDILGGIGLVDAPLVDAITGLAAVSAQAALDLILAASAHRRSDVK